MWFRLLALTAAYSVFQSPTTLSSAPEVPNEIAVPAGCSLAFKAEAKGVQIYRSAETKAGTLEWVLEAPLAELADSNGRRIGCHFEGPMWEASDGSRASRDKTHDVKSAPAPNPSADLPWLLLAVKSDDGRRGMLSNVTYVQRIQTVGGLAPSERPTRAGTKVGVPYRAVYAFYAASK